MSQLTPARHFTDSHVHGHTLDLLITSDEQVLTMLPVDPPLLLDHSFVVADCDCTPPSTTSTSYRQVRNWRVLDVDAFAADLQSSLLITTPAEDIETGVDCYNSTQRSLLDKHAPVELKRVTTRSSSARLYYRECHNVNQEIRASVSLTTHR